MSKYFKSFNFGQADVKPKLRLGSLLLDTSSTCKAALLRISPFNLPISLWDKFKWVRKGVSRKGTVSIPVPAIFNLLTVLGSFKTLLMESSVSGL